MPIHYIQNECGQDKNHLTTFSVNKVSIQTSLQQQRDAWGRWEGNTQNREILKNTVAHKMEIEKRGRYVMNVCDWLVYMQTTSYITKPLI